MIHSDRLSSFLVFAEELNFTRAAKKLHLSQPSLFAQIKKLEEEVERALYRKQGRALFLTPAGARLLAHARECRDRDEFLRSELSGRDRQSPLVLAAGEGALLYLLSASLKKLRRSDGQRLQVLTRNASATIDAVAQGEATVGVTIATAEQPGIDSKRLCQTGLSAVMPKSHSFAKKRSLSLSTLDGVQLVTAPHGAPHRLKLEQLFSEADAQIAVSVEASGWASMMHLASLGLGIAVVNDICVPPKGTVARPIRGVPKLEYRVLWREGDDSDDARLMSAAILGG